MNKKIKSILIVLAFVPVFSFAQDFLSGGQVHGNFEIDAQYYQPDSKLGITDSSIAGNNYGMNAFGNLIYTNGKFSAGLRYEAYLPPLNGFDKRQEGQGIPYWFATYKGEEIELTVGHFYEQFGNGLVLRSYEEWALGYDNNLNGVRVKYKPMDGVTLKGIIGTQRLFWEPVEDQNRAIVRGFDAEFYLNDLFKGLKDSKTNILLGGSFVSKQQEVTHQFFTDSLIYTSKMPKNVAAYAARLNLSRSGFTLNTEYARKINDPSQRNNFIYREGEALFAALSYSKKGFGITLSGKRIDNMSFKSDIYEETSSLDINYLPPLTKQHLYSLANIYPYATQPNGEMGLRGQIVYSIPRKSKLGGKYGTKLELNYSVINAIDKKEVAPDIAIDQEGTLGYDSDFFKFGELEYFQDFTFKITRKLNKSFKAKLTYINLQYNIEVIEGHPGDPMVFANIGVADVTYKINRKKSLRFEYQQLFSKQDRGDWMMGLIEFNVAPKWFFSIMDEYNYGNPESDEKLHYYTGAVAFVKNTTRVAVSYGRQREGLLCVGGVCRVVPASTGFSLTITSSF
jgi:Family of unknown function (DUF6029)